MKPYKTGNERNYKHLSSTVTMDGLELNATLALSHNPKGLSITLPTTWMQFIPKGTLIRTLIGDLIVITSPTGARKLLITKKNAEYLDWDEFAIVDVDVTYSVKNKTLWIEPINYE